MNTSEVSIELALAQFFTPALRAWLINYLLPDSLASEMPYALLELGYHELPANLSRAAAVRDFLKREMSQLAARQMPEAAARLLQLCEQIVQLYLLAHPAEAPELEHLNQLLPPGVSFSLVSGRLLFEPALYFQPHNLYDQEQTLFARFPLSDVARADPAAAHAKMPEGLGGCAAGPEQPAAGQPRTAIAIAQSDAPPAEASVPSVCSSGPPEAMLVSAEPETLPRHLRLRQIRERRLQLLKEWES